MAKAHISQVLVEQKNNEKQTQSKCKMKEWRNAARALQVVSVTAQKKGHAHYLLSIKTQTEKQLFVSRFAVRSTMGSAV